MAKKSWNDLSTTQQRAIIVAGVIETALTVWTLRDLSRRDASEVRGPKFLWRAASAVQPFGPMAYVAFGRRKAA